MAGSRSDTDAYGTFTAKRQRPALPWLSAPPPLLFSLLPSLPLLDSGVSFPSSLALLSLEASSGPSSLKPSDEESWGTGGGGCLAAADPVHGERHGDFRYEGGVCNVHGSCSSIGGEAASYHIKFEAWQLD